MQTILITGGAGFIGSNFRSGFINKAQLDALVTPLLKSGYAKNLMKIK